MRPRRLIFVAAALFGVWLVVESFASSWALADLGARPVTALLRGAERVEVPAPGGTLPAPGTARAIGGAGIMLGLSTVYQMPDGSIVTCRFRPVGGGCDGGWTAERTPR
jgi:hypothetical protein